MSDHLRPTLFQRPDQVADPLYVILPVTNSARFRSRWKLYEDAVKRCTAAGAIPYTVEIAFGQRAFAVTSSSDPHHLQLRTSHELWFKENAVNVCAGRLPADCKYLAYVDADSRPARDDWANETVHQLQHYAAVQMWSEYQCLNANHELMSHSHSFMASYLNGWPTTPKVTTGAYPYPYPGAKWPGPPGLAWAWRREAWDEVGGMLDICVLGSADWYMANALIGRLDDRIMSPRFSPGYRRAVYRWQELAKALKKNIGVVPGLWLHHWHGPMKARQYDTRNQVLIDTQFDPAIDLKRDMQGLYQLTDRSIPLRDGVRAYFHTRDEDA